MMNDCLCTYEFAVPSGPPLNANVTAVDSGTAYLTWRPPSPEHVNGIIRLYSVRVENMVTGDSSLLNTTAEFLTVSSLHPFYTYSFSVAGYTTGVGVYSEELIVILPEDGQYNHCSYMYSPYLFVSDYSSQW